MEPLAVIFFAFFFISIILIFVGPIITEKYHPSLFGKQISIDYGTFPLTVVLLSYFSGIISLEMIKNGIFGKPPLQPYTIVIFFFSFAYLCVSLDQTGIFRFVALKLINRSNGDGKRLFSIIFILSSGLTVVTSNDIVIMTLTPIVLNVIKETKIKGLPYLIAQFFGANIWSMFLLIGNPTNIIVGIANNIDFVAYLRLMFVPTIAGGLITYILLRMLFHKSISMSSFPSPQINPNSAFSDRTGAKIITPLFFTCIILLSISVYIDVDMWIISAIFAGIAFLIDFTRFIKAKVKGLTQNLIFDKCFSQSSIPTGYPELRITIKRLPYKIFSFTLSFFIFVEGLQYYGFTTMLASFFAKFVGGPIQNALFMAISSMIFANLMNNQPMTVLFTEVLAEPALLSSGPAYAALLYGVIIGSNLGANITFFGALAGLMWKKMLSDQCEFVSLKTFFQTGILTMIPAVLVIVTLLGFSL